ncbi:unnamed protein product, partial [Linum tenue]
MASSILLIKSSRALLCVVGTIDTDTAIRFPLSGSFLRPGIFLSYTTNIIWRRRRHGNGSGYFPDQSA